MKLPLLCTPPAPLDSLFNGDHTDSRDFQRNIRKFNKAFAMTSFGATREVRWDGWDPTFKVQGQVYHRVGSLLPQADQHSAFLQLYFIGNPEDEAHQRCGHHTGLKEVLVYDLQQSLHACDWSIVTNATVQRMSANARATPWGLEIAIAMPAGTSKSWESRTTSLIAVRLAAAQRTCHATSSCAHRWPTN